MRRWISIVVVAAGLAGGGCAASAQDGPPAPATGADPRMAASCHPRGHGLFSLPDPRCTPGASDPRVTQADAHTTICRRGYTRRVRPPERVTEPEKRASMQAYGHTGRLGAYEYDHLVPLELGGAPNDLHNLWPEPGASPNPKDRLENLLRRRVCAGTIPLATARREIATNWVAAYRRLIG